MINQTGQRRLIIGTLLLAGVAEVYPLDRAAEAQLAPGEHHVGKIVLQMTGQG